MTRKEPMFRPGRLLTDPHDVLDEVAARRYVFEKNKPQHPSWVSGWSLNFMMIQASSGRLRAAIPNPAYRPTASAVAEEEAKL